MASTFDKYVYKYAKLKYQPQVSTATAGIVALVIDRDYMDPPQVGSWAQAMSYESVVSGNVWTTMSTMLKRETAEKKTYFTNFSNDVAMRESEQFKFYAITTGVPASTTCGQLYLEYEIELISPVFAPDDVSSNLTLFQMTSVLAGNVTVPLTSGTFTITGLPQISDIGSAIIEIMMSGTIASSAALVGLLVGALGPQYSPGSVNTLRLYARAGTAANSYSLFSSYPAALNNTSVYGGLYNSTLLTISLMSTPRIYYRIISNID